MINCTECGKELNSWELKFNKILPGCLCEEHMAKEFAVTVDDLRKRLEDFFDIRPCQGI